MPGTKRYIPMLILAALISLIGLQVAWLFFAYRYKAQELKDKTREAALAAINRLEKEEDSKIILRNIDSLVTADSLMDHSTQTHVKVIVGNIKNKIKMHDPGAEEIRAVSIGNDIMMDSLIRRSAHGQVNVIVSNIRNKINTSNDGTEREEISEVRIGNDTATATTVVKLHKSNAPEVIVRSEQKKSIQLKKKAGNLQALFMKMAMRAGEKARHIENRVDQKHVVSLVSEELIRRGIDMKPEVLISNNPGNKAKTRLLFPGMNTQRDSGFELNESFVSLPLFPGDIFQNDLMLEVGFLSSAGYLVRQMAGLLVLSLLLSVLIGFVIIYIFRRMISQEKLNAMKNDFINNMTHELKTPIATISLAVDAINNPAVRNDGTKLDTYTQILKEENKKLNDHVEHALQMSLLDAGELQLNKKPVDLAELICKAAQSFRLQAESRKATITFDTLEGPFTVNGDAFHLTNAFSNLIDNALKYSGENCRVTITVSNENGAIIASIKDNGVGIAPSQQQRVFEKFYRVPDGDRHDVKGSGLGLSYVKSIVEAHGGSIRLESETGKGSEFIIKLNAYAA